MPGGNAATSEEVVRLPGHSSSVFSLAISPDGKTLVSSSGDSTLWLFLMLRCGSRQFRQDRAEIDMDNTWQAFWRVTVEGRAVADVVRDLGVESGRHGDSLADGTLLSEPAGQTRGAEQAIGQGGGIGGGEVVATWFVA